MKVLLQSSMVFFGTLLAAGLIALGEPARVEVQMVQAAPQHAGTVVALVAPAR
jgi:hypothetical protein